MSPLAPYLIWFKIGGAALAAVVIAWGAHWTTATYYRLQISEGEKRHALEIIIAQDKAAEAQEAADKITYGVNAEAAEARAKRLEIVISNLQKVRSYVPPEVDRLFPLPCGFVRLHDAGARGIDAATVSLPTGKTDSDQCDVAPSVAAGIVQRNYGLALDWKGEVDGWWKWYGEQKANYDAYREKLKPKEPEPERGFFDRINPF